MTLKEVVFRYPFAAAFVAGAVCLTVLPFCQKQFLRAPPPIGSLGNWELVDESGKPFGSVDLKGKVWVASFFFTRCPGACADEDATAGKILRHVEDLAGKAGVAPIALVSFTVDPTRDTPEVLAAEATRRAVPRGRWKLLTGDPVRVRDLLVNRFKVEMGDAPDDKGKIRHSRKLALVDQNGDVRGFWDADELARGNLINAARLLAKSGPRP